MPATPTHLARLAKGDAAAAVEQAAQAVRAGDVVIFPTETVYGVGVSVASREGLSRLRSLAPATGMTPTGEPRPGTWHAPSREAVIGAVPLRFPLHRRAIDALVPGPVRFLVELDEGDIAKSLRTIGAAKGTIERAAAGGGLAFSVRVPDHEIATMLLERSGVPMIAERLGALGWGDDPSAPSFQTRAADAGVRAILYDGKPRLSRPSTVVRLGRDGSARVVEEGAMSTRAVQKRLQRLVLFVCTGNTCRSPMAESAARHLLATEFKPRPGDVPLAVASAGTSAATGDRPTPEGVDAMRALGVQPVDHRARELTRAMIDEAEVVYAMTRSHARAMSELVPDAGDKVQLLDPAGANVPDPIGAGRAMYDKAAARILELVRERLTELTGKAES